MTPRNILFVALALLGLWLLFMHPILTLILVGAIFIGRSALKRGRARA